LWVREDYRKILIRQGIDKLEELIACSEVKKYFNGRGLLASLEINDSHGERMVIRSYMHGGWYGKINKDFFWGKFRPLRELIVNDEVSRRGIQTTVILAALSKRVIGPLYKSTLISKEISGALDLIHYLKILKQRSVSERLKAKAGLAKAVAVMVRKMHDQGIYHADLHLKNILVQEKSGGDFSVYLIDFDKSEIWDRLSFKKRIKNLMRFNRSAEKLKGKGLPITFSDQWRFLREYFHDEQQVIQKIRKLIKRYLLWQEFHRMGWRLASFFAASFSSAFSPRQSA
jgi:tRNA A-37 threonylcarbamoyl transferase component Bud32